MKFTLISKEVAVEAHRFRRDFLTSPRAGTDRPTRPEPSSLLADGCFTMATSEPYSFAPRCTLAPLGESCFVGAKLALNSCEDSVLFEFLYTRGCQKRCCWFSALA